MEMTAFPVINLAETGRSIERHRRQAKLTVRDLQDYFGFEYPQAIYKWQHGECLPTVDNLLALARLLRVPMEDLLVYDDQGGFFTVHCVNSERKGDWRPPFGTPLSDLPPFVGENDPLDHFPGPPHPAPYMP